MQALCMPGPDVVVLCRYAEKQVGYMACSVLLTEVCFSHIFLPAATLSFCPVRCTTCYFVMQKDEFLRLIINSIRNDLISRNEAFQCLALGFIGNGQSFLIHTDPPIFTPTLFAVVCQHTMVLDMMTVILVCSWRTRNGILAGCGCHGSCGMHLIPARTQTHSRHLHTLLGTHAPGYVCLRIGRRQLCMVLTLL